MRPRRVRSACALCSGLTPPSLLGSALGGMATHRGVGRAEARGRGCGVRGRDHASLQDCQGCGWTSTGPGRMGGHSGQTESRDLAVPRAAGVSCFIIVRPDGLKNQVGYGSRGKFNKLNTGWAGGAKAGGAVMGLRRGQRRESLHTAGRADGARPWLPTPPHTLPSNNLAAQGP